MISLRRDAVALDIAPARGGGVLRFAVGGQAIFAAVRGPAPEDMACVPLLPFANRIANGRFAADGLPVTLSLHANEPHALHGMGWTRAWTPAGCDPDSAELHVECAAGDGGWPWAWHGWQRYALTDDGYRHSIAHSNRGNTPKPAGIGLHPWLPRNALTRYHGLHRQEWQPGPDQLPSVCTSAATPIDWWQRAAVGTRPIDCCYGGRDGALRVDWPDRRLTLAIHPDPVFAFTQVYVPDADFFCVEPVSHLPDAVNRGGDIGLRWLAPGDTLAGTVAFRVSSGANAG